MSRFGGGDDELWEQVKKSVVPLRKPAEIVKHGVSEHSLAKPQANKPVRSDAPKHPEPGHAKPGQPRINHLNLDDNTFRKISRGRMAIDAKVDLHGMTQTEAHGVLLRFLEHARTNHKRTVLVITGKGMLGRGILREVVPRWLHEMPFRTWVSGIREAHVSHGGSGALYVRLRKPDRIPK